MPPAIVQSAPFYSLCAGFAILNSAIDRRPARNSRFATENGPIVKIIESTARRAVELSAGPSLPRRLVCRASSVCSGWDGRNVFAKKKILLPRGMLLRRGHIIRSRVATPAATLLEREIYTHAAINNEQRALCSPGRSATICRTGASRYRVLLQLAQLCLGVSSSSLRKIAVQVSCEPLFVIEVVGVGGNSAKRRRRIRKFVHCVCACVCVCVDATFLWRSISCFSRVACR